jgi:uncharacterized protein (TIGR03437 family)
VFSSYAGALFPREFGPASLAAADRLYVSDGEKLAAIDFAASMPEPYLACVVNSASLESHSPPAVAPGELVTLWGAGLGPRQPAGPAFDIEGRITSSVAGVRVLFDGVPAPLLYVSDSQVNAVVPFGVGSQTRIEVEYQEASSNQLVANVARSRLGIFTQGAAGMGFGAVINQDGTLNSPEHRAPKGSIVAIFATGAGQLAPAGIDGALAGEPLPRPETAVCVRIHGPGCNAEVLYAGPAPTLVLGMLQVNARVPEDIPSGIVELQLQAPGDTSQVGVALAVQ